MKTKNKEALIIGALLAIQPKQLTDLFILKSEGSIPEFGWNVGTIKSVAINYGPPKKGKCGKIKKW